MTMNMSKTKRYKAWTQQRLDKEVHKTQNFNSVTNKTQ